MNAARELALLLDRWSTIPAGQNLLEVHGGSEMESWRALVHAMDLVGQVGGILDAMEQSGRSVDHYRRSEAEWVKGLTQPDLNWYENAGSQRQVIAQTTIDQLMALADVVDGESDRYQVAEPQRKTSIDALDDIVALLADEDALPLSELERRYVFELINNVRGLLDEASVFNGLDLARRIHQLVGYLTVLADDAERLGKAPVANKLRGFARKVRPFVVNTTIAVAGAVDVAASVKALTS